MKALTLTQPWATLIANGAKRIETRSWGTGFRGCIAIHAAKGLGPVGGKRGLIEQCVEVPFCHAVTEAFLASTEEATEAARNLPLGAIVAVATLANCRRIDMALRAQVVAQTITPWEINFGNYESGRYAWFLEDVTRMSVPIDCKGALSLWEVPPEIVAQIPRNHVDTNTALWRAQP